MEFVAGTRIERNDNGAWSWFLDERVIVHENRLLAMSIRSTNQRCRDGMPGPQGGHCGLAVHDPATGSPHAVVLHEHFEQDEHDGPELHVRLAGVVDGQRHHETFRRPIIPIRNDPRMAPVRMRGRYKHNQRPWNTRVVARLLFREEP